MTFKNLASGRLVDNESGFQDSVIPQQDNIVRVATAQLVDSFRDAVSFFGDESKPRLVAWSILDLIERNQKQ